MNGGTSAAPPSAAALPPGALFAGDLRIERMLGTGGMGIVYLAHDLTLEREVALKVMLPGAEADAGDPASGPTRRRERRFLREARIMAGLDHPSILAVHRVGEDPATGLHYFTMKPCLLSAEEVRRLCDGPFDSPYPQSLSAWGKERRALSLAALLEGDKALAERAVVKMARELVGAIGYAHRLQPPVIHRDIKPSNILFDAAGRAFLTDFGIAKRMRDPDDPDNSTTITSDGEGGKPFVGTASFAAPEQRRTGELTPAADYYSLGVVLYRALTGSMPAGLKPPSEFDPGHVSRRWDALLKGMLEPDPARRLADPAAVEAALAAVSSDRPARRRTRLVAGVLAAAAAAGLAAAVARSRTASARSGAAAPPPAGTNNAPAAPAPSGGAGEDPSEPVRSDEQRALLRAWEPPKGEQTAKTVLARAERLLASPYESVRSEAIPMLTALTKMPTAPGALPGADDETCGRANWLLAKGYDEGAFGSGRREDSYIELLAKSAARLGVEEAREWIERRGKGPSPHEAEQAAREAIGRMQEAGGPD